MTNEPIGSGDDDSLLEDVFSSDRDRGGKDAPSGDDDQSTAQAPPQQEADAETDGQEVEEPSSERPSHMVPLKELRSEREKRQAMEKRLEEIERENERREAEWQRRISDLTTRITQPPVQHQQPQPPPDPYTDPEGYTEYRMSAVQQQFENRLLDYSETAARRAFGNDTVDAAFQAAQAQGLIQQRAFLGKPDPWGAMVEWHKQYRAQQEVGTDLEAFKKRIAEEAVQKALAELKAGGGQGKAQKFPGTLADQTATGDQGVLPQSDEAMAAEIFDTDRRAKRYK